MEHQFPVTGPISVDLRIGGGAVILRAIETATATVSVRPYDENEPSRTAAENTIVEFVGDVLRIETPRSNGWALRRGRVRVDVYVPLDSAVRASLGSADMRTDGQLGVVDVATGSGDVTVGSTTGDLTVGSGSGDLTVGDIGGALKVKTGSGDVRITTINGSADLTVASGDIRVQQAFGPVRAMSASGDIEIAEIRGDATTANEARINAASGDVSVGVLAGTGVWLDLVTVSGSTTSDLNVGAAAPATGATLTLRVHTVSGDIAVRRVGSVPSHA